MTKGYGRRIIYSFILIMEKEENKLGKENLWKNLRHQVIPLKVQPIHLDEP